MAAKHFMIYYHRGTGTYVVTEPRPWARENEIYEKPDFDFKDFQYKDCRKSATRGIFNKLKKSK